MDSCLVRASVTSFANEISPRQHTVSAGVATLTAHFTSMQGTSSEGEKMLFHSVGRFRVALGAGFSRGSRWQMPCQYQTLLQLSVEFA